MTTTANLSPTSPRMHRRGTFNRRRAPSHLPPVQDQESHDNALNVLRNYLRGRTCYDVFPVSFRLIVLDTKLEVQKALQCFLLNGQSHHQSLSIHFANRSQTSDGRAVPRRPHPGVVSAPLWNSEKSCFAGMLTVSDIIHLIQYYYRTSNFATAATDVETFRLESLRGKLPLERLAQMSDPLSSDIERALGVDTPPLLWASPDQSLYEAASLLIQTHARRLPLLDNDNETGPEMIVSIMTQYRLLKSIAINVRFPRHFDQDNGADVNWFHPSVRKKSPTFTFPFANLGIGTYVANPREASEGSLPFWLLATATMSAPVFDVVHEFSGRGISAVPIIDEDGIVVNLYETVDVIVRYVPLPTYEHRRVNLTLTRSLYPCRH